MKSCKKCGETKLLTEFYAHPMMRDGHLNACKSCIKEDRRKHLEANGEEIRARSRAAYQRPEAKEKQRKYYATYNATPKGKEVRAKAIAASRAKNKSAVNARAAVQWAVMKGKLKPLPCLICGSEKVEAHHGSYDLPLDVSWLCRKHHAQLHREHREMLRNERHERLQGNQRSAG
jgi:hypothetical protein